MPPGDPHLGPLLLQDIAERLKRVVPYLQRNHGGITVSGGEPMLQPYFLAAVYQEAHALGLTTCIDTTGQGNKQHWNTVLPHTDHVSCCPPVLRCWDPRRLIHSPTSCLPNHRCSCAQRHQIPPSTNG